MLCIDYSVSKTDEQSYLDYDVYKIEILKENKGFTAQINTGLINKQVSVAIMVYDTVRWIHIEATGYNKWFRNE